MRIYDVKSLGHCSVDVGGRPVVRSALCQPWGGPSGYVKYILSLILLPLEIHKKTKGTGRLGHISVGVNQERERIRLFFLPQNMLSCTLIRRLGVNPIGNLPRKKNLQKGHHPSALGLQFRYKSHLSFCLFPFRYPQQDKSDIKFPSYYNPYSPFNRAWKYFLTYKNLLSPLRWKNLSS